jgi:dienelactone hydrolase
VKKAMRRFWAIVVGAFLIGVQISGTAAVKGQEVDYSAGGVALKGYIAYDDSIKGKRPGVLVVHEWWGHNEYARKRARMLAKLGYTAMALDMYGNGKQAEHPKEAGKFAGQVMSNLPVAKARFLAALDVLKSHAMTNPDKIAAIGYCFGGGVVLAMARQGIDLDAVVSFHGSLRTAHPAKPGDIKAKVLICNGEADPFTTAEDIAAFKSEMQNAKVDMQFKSYPGAKHAFSNPDATALGKKFNLPLQYNARADKESWQDMQDFFKKIL